MTKQSFLLDPNAQSYTDDEIVGKVNNATATITRVGFTDLDKIDEGTTNKTYTDTEKTKLSGIEDNAKDDQTDTEIRDLIVGIAEADRQIVITDPQSGEFKVLAVQRDSTGKLKVEYDDVAEP